MIRRGRTWLGRTVHGPLALTDVLVAVAFAIVGLYMVVESVVRLDAFDSRRPGAGLLPFWVGAAMTATAALVLLQIERGLIVASAADFPTRRGLLRAGGFLALITSAVLVLPLLGASLSLALFILLEMLIIEHRPPVSALAAALMIPLVFYLVFERLLGIPLPAGALG